jgi:hypothetical protein
MTDTSIILPYVYEATRARVLSALAVIAIEKNVRLSKVDCAAFAEGTITYLHYSGLCKALIDDDVAAVTAMESGIDNMLDRFAAEEAVLASARAQGVHNGDVDWNTVALFADQIMHRLRKEISAGSFYRWPDIRGGMSEAFAPFGIAMPPASFASGVDRHG